MVGVLCSLLALVLVGSLLAKKYNPQAVLFLGGLFLLTCTAIFGISPLLSAKATTNFIGFDIFKTFSDLFSTRIAGLGLTLMAIGGFSRYMEHVGASKALFAVFEKILLSINSPYLLLSVAFLVSQVLVIFIPSHAGLGLLLMVTMYPILIRSGVSKLSALGVIGCAQFIDVGPGSGNAILAAQTAGIDVAEYFVYYQLKVFIPITLALAVVHFFVQRWWDKREGYVYNVDEVKKAAIAEEQDMPPRIYALLPVIPLLLILGFSNVVKSPIKMDVVTAMLISTLISIVAEFFRKRNFKEVMKSFMLFFEGMGKILTGVVSLIVCGEFFAAGLIKIGVVQTLIDASKTAGFGLAPMVILASIALAALAFIMGSGNAAFFSFAPLTKDIAKGLGHPVISFIFPLQIMTSFGRVASPITAAIVAIAGIAEVSPFQVAKRTCIPMAFAAVMNMVLYFVFFY